MDITEDIAKDVAAEVRKCWEQAGQPTGSCLLFALVAAAVLTERHKLPAKVVGGRAAFSVTSDLKDVLVWDRRASKNLIMDGLEFHAWVRVGKTILDCSPMSFNKTLEKLTAADGHVTHGSWDREFHLVDVKVAGEQEGRFLRNDYSPGAFFYRQEADVVHAIEHNQSPKVVEELKRWLA